MDEKKEKDKLKPVVSREEGIAEKKKSFGSKLIEAFLPCDRSEIGDYILWDLLIPGAQDMALDVLEMMFDGGGRSRRRRRKKEDYTDYYYGGSKKKKEREARRRDRDRDRDRDEEKVDYRDVVLKHRDDAEEVIDQLHYRIEETGSASIADLLDLVELPTTPSQNDYGWERKGDISLKRVSNGWLINVERARYLL